MRLSEREFKGMNTSLRRLIQRTLEFPLFKRLGLSEKHNDILEIGCGSGYGAFLLSQLQPKSYVGVDIMPEQIELAIQLAQRKHLSDYTFLLRDATNLDCFPQESKDIVVMFGILHHIPRWPQVLKESYRVLRSGGKLFVEEPDGRLLKLGEQFFPCGHPREAMFRFPEFENILVASGFTILHSWKGFGFGVYAAQK